MHYYVEILQREFDNRREENARYSLRAYAKFLDMDPSSLSAVLRGKRLFPLKKVEFVSSKLHLEGEDRRRFLQSVFNAHKLDIRIQIG